VVQLLTFEKLAHSSCEFGKVNVIFLKDALANVENLVILMSWHLENFGKFAYSQTCVQRPPLGLKNSGCCSKLVVIQRLILKSFYIFWLGGD